ncbi:helix-turn-helix domain-containing protein [Streptomyces sp. NPDC047868]|uniref:helix-turn-helix domain-containing protein n=1 Tax=Streptomyces sp. NPDC047868 TaxID=3155480 RepID=UPI003453B93B
MTAANQWVHATTGRITTCAHSWMQAVHWIAGSGLYTPNRTHGPKWGATTIAIAQELAALKVCRPGIAYLMRKLKASERTIQYHLGMLREAGLLVYRVKGTRLSWQPNQASVFERIIPLAFDEALGIRTVGEGVQRRPVGAAPEHRTLLGKLAKKAARKTRRPRRRTPVSGRGRCTPMEGGTSASSSTGLTHSPPETDIASGEGESSTGKQSQRGTKKLNKVGRRYQLARELIQTVPWLQNAAVPRIAWIIRHVSDAGWTVTEVQAAAERMVVDKEARRPSAVLAFRLASCHLLYTTPGRRKTLVEDWRDSRLAAQARHSETVYDGYDEGPRTVAGRRAMDEAFAAIRDRLTSVIEEPVDLSPIALEDLSKAEVTDMRAAAMKDPGLIFAAIDLIGEAQTRRLYTHRLVDQTLALEAIAARNTVLIPDF